MSASEDAEQIALITRLRSEGWFVFHIPNGMNTNAITGARFKRLGVVAGIPDLIAINQDGKLIFIEMKKEKGRMSKAQESIHGQLKERDQVIIVGYGAKDAYNKIHRDN